MKKLLPIIVALVLGLAVGAGGIYYGLPHMMASKIAKAKAVALQTPAVTFTKTNSTVVAYTDLQSNLAGSGHYIRLDLSFEVLNTALTTDGGDPTTATANGGTGSALLDAKVQAALADVLRSSSYTELTSSGGLSTLKMEISVAMQSVFGPGNVGDIYMTNIVTQ